MDTQTTQSTTKHKKKSEVLNDYRIANESRGEHIRPEGSINR